MKTFSIYLLYLILLFKTAAVNLYAEPIDLTKNILFVKRGFSIEWTKSLPEDKSWIKIPPAEDGGRKARVSEINFPDFPERNFLSPAGYADEAYTFATSFEISENINISEKIYGLFLAQIGMNWEIYINGRLIRKEMHLSPEGGIQSSRNMRDVLEYIHPSFLKKGNNILAFHIIGDPYYVETGFYWSGPYIIDEYKKLLDKNSETLPLVLISIYLFLGVYHLFLYIKRTSEKYTFYFGIFSVLFFTYLFTRSHTVYSLIPDTTIITRIELSVLFALFPAAGSFLSHIIKKRIDLPLRFYTIFCAVLIVFTIPFSLAFITDILRIWQYTAIIPLSYFIFMLTSAFIKKVKEAGTSGSASPSAGSRIVKTLSQTFEGNLLIGIFILIACAIFDILDAVYLATGIALAKYGFFVTMIGITFILANRFQFIHSQVENLNVSLQNKISDLHEANIKISLSEERYRLLIEGTSDIIFSLDNDWKFTTVNKSIKNHLKIKPEEIMTKSLFDLLYDGNGASSISHQVIKEKLDEFARTKKPVQFKAEFKDFGTNEPRDMVVTLEYINIEGENEILGKASRKMGDSLLKYLVSEYQKFSIENYLITADEISHRLTRNLERYIAPGDVSFIRIALREIIINSVEHGNLELTYDEKTSMLTDNRYIETIGKRQNDPRYTNRRVKIEYSMDHKKVVYKIMDEGKGFNFEKIINTGIDTANAELLAHGRGIIMAKSTFNQVKYSNNGTMVILRKDF